MFEFFHFYFFQFIRFSVAIVRLQWCESFSTFIECKIQLEILHFYLGMFVYMMGKDKINDKIVKTFYKMY